MSNFLPVEVIAAMRDSRANGMSLRAVAREHGVSTNTVKKYIRSTDGARCDCGQRASHQGWCKARYAKSAARQAFHAGRRGVFINYTIPSRRSRVTESTTEKQKWFGVIGTISPIHKREYLGAIGEVDHAVERVPLVVREDVRGELIVAVLEGRLPRSDVKRAVTAFIGFVWRGCVFRGVDQRFDYVVDDSLLCLPGHGRAS